jgi:hypothetical protein
MGSNMFSYFKEPVKANDKDDYRGYNKRYSKRF